MTVIDDDDDDDDDDDADDDDWLIEHCHWHAKYWWSSTGTVHIGKRLITDQATKYRNCTLKDCKSGGWGLFKKQYATIGSALNDGSFSGTARPFLAKVFRFQRPETMTAKNMVMKCTMTSDIFVHSPCAKFSQNIEILQNMNYIHA